MKDRIRQLMTDKAMSQRSFANELCIAEATLSGIFNGRTRPTNQTITAIHEAFPDVNIQWLMFGEGEMYSKSQANTNPTDANISTSDNNTVDQAVSPAATTDSTPQQLDLFSQQPNTSASNFRTKADSQAQNRPEIHYIEKIVDKPQRKITEIRIFFDDGTYETFTK